MHNSKKQTFLNVMTRTITITSGKGGVGKTNLSANLSLQLSASGKRTCLFDADLGLANINLLFGLYPEHNIEDVITGRKPLAEIIIKNYAGIDIIPGSSGVEKIAELDSSGIEKLVKSFSMLSEYDFLIFDTSAGVSKNVLSFCLASSEIIIIITPEPTSLTDAYALLKILSFNGLASPVKIVVNQCKNTSIAKQTYLKFKEVAKKYLSIDLQPLGVVLEDSKITEAVKFQQPFISRFPDTIASKCIKAIANNILNNKTGISETYNLESFWKRCIDIFKSPVINLKNSGDTKSHSEQLKKKTVLKDIAVEQKTRALPDRSERSEESEKDELAVSRNIAKGVQQIDDKTLNFLMNKLVESVSSISSELKYIRKAIDTNGKNFVPGPGTHAHSNNTTSPVKLDFDIFLHQHRENK